MTIKEIVHNLQFGLRIHFLVSNQYETYLFLLVQFCVDKTKWHGLLTWVNRVAWSACSACHGSDLMPESATHTPIYIYQIKYPGPCEIQQYQLDHYLECMYHISDVDKKWLNRLVVRASCQASHPDTWCKAKSKLNFFFSVYTGDRKTCHSIGKLFNP